MKAQSLIILVILFFVHFGILAQNQQINLEDTEEFKNSISLNQTGRNELKFNLLSSVIGYPEINYERLLATNMGLGLAAGITFTNREERFQDYLLGFYRIYFGKKIANGAFIEANLGAVYNSDKDYYYDYTEDPACPNCYNIENNNYKEKSTLNLGIGFAVGYKFLSKNGLQGEIFGGLGRNSGDPAIDLFPRVGVNIGKRFGK